MAQNYGIDTTTYEGDKLLGSHPPIEMPITVGSGAGSLTRGRVLGKKSADGKYYPWNPSATDGTENPVCILGVDVDASSADQKAFAYFHGEFNKEAVEFGGVTDAQKEACIGALMDKGIFIK